MRTILLMTDFSDNARNAIKYAIDAFGESAEYIILNSYIIRKTASSLVNIADELREISEGDLRRELKFVRDTYPQLSNLKVTTLSEYGDPADVLLTIQNQNIIDLVVMGTKGATGLTKIFFGSVTAGVIRNTKLPVLAIPEHSTFTSLETIAFAADLLNNDDPNIVQPLVTLAEKFKSKVYLLNILKQGELAKEKTRAQIEELKSSNYLGNANSSWEFLESDDVADTVEAFCEKNKVNLLAVIARNNRMLDRLLHSSVSQDLILNAKLPILAMDDSYSD